MRIVFNFSNLRVGGAIQVAKNFIEGAAKRKDWFAKHQTFWIISDQVFHSIEDGVLEELGSEYIIFRHSPAELLAGIMVRREIHSAVKRFGPGLVFSMFGPTFLNFGCTHLVGFGNAFLLPVNSQVWLRHSLLDAIKERLLAYPIRRYLISREASAFIVETEAAAVAVRRQFQRETYVVNNTYGFAFEPFRSAAPRVVAPAVDSMFHIYCIGHPYPHKDFIGVLNILTALKADHPRVFERVLVRYTVAPELRAWERLCAVAVKLGVRERIATVGIIRSENLVDVYSDAAMVIQPSFLEIFSATHAECMVMGCPVVSVDADYSRAICGSAGVYYGFGDYSAAASAVARLIEDVAYYRSVAAASKTAGLGLLRPYEKMDGYIRVMDAFVAR